MWICKKHNREEIRADVKVHFFDPDYTINYITDKNGSLDNYVGEEFQVFKSGYYVAEKIELISFHCDICDKEFSRDELEKYAEWVE